MLEVIKNDEPPATTAEIAALEFSCWEWLRQVDQSERLDCLREMVDHLLAPLQCAGELMTEDKLDLIPDPSASHGLDASAKIFAEAATHAMELAHLLRNAECRARVVIANVKPRQRRGLS